MNKNFPEDPSQARFSGQVKQTAKSVKGRDKEIQCNQESEKQFKDKVSK